MLVRQKRPVTFPLEPHFHTAVTGSRTAPGCSRSRPSVTEEHHGMPPGSIYFVNTSVFGEGAPPIAPHAEALRAVFREHSCDRARAKVEYFHAGRGLPRTRGTRLAAASSAASDARLRLTQSNEKYRPLRADVVAAIHADS